MDDSSVGPLNRVPAGRTVVVVSLAGGRGLTGRLVRMGVSVGSQVEVIRSSNGRGGPTLIGKGDMRLAIGRGMAERIIVASNARREQ